MFTIQSEIQNITFEVRVVKSNLLKTPIKRLKKLTLLQSSLTEVQLPQYLEGDVMRCIQVLINLIKNSFRFSSSGSVYAFIAYDEDSEMLSAAIIDNGYGISSKDLS